MGRSVLLAALALALGTAACRDEAEDDLLVLVRANHAPARAIADAYLAARDLPSDRVLELALSDPPDRREISARKYLDEIARPTLAHLAEHDPEARVSLLVTTRGLPLRIGHCDTWRRHYPRDCDSAAVDAALAQLGAPGLEGRAFARVANPFFRDPRPFSRFRREEPDARLRFLVARLTAPPYERTASPARPPRWHALIERARAHSERRHAPSWRILSLTPRGLRTAAESLLLDELATRLSRLGHRVCDGCDEPFASAATTGVIVQSDAAATMGLSVPPPAAAGVSQANGTATTGLAAPGVVVGLAGARDAADFDRFLARWIDRGAGLVSTHLADPTLAGVLRADAQLRALAAGRSAAEAHFQALPQLGWLNVFVGDPMAVLRAASESATAGDDDDYDRDGIPDLRDNCPHEANPDQRDTNRDGFGNRCDADVDDDGRVDTSWGAIYPLDQRGDLEAITLTAQNGPYDPDHDLDGDGRVDERDLVIAQMGLFRPPGR